MTIFKCLFFLIFLFNMNRANGFWNQEQVASHFKKTQSLSLADISSFIDNLQQIHRNVDPSNQVVVEEVIRGYAQLIDHHSVPELRHHGINDLSSFFSFTLDELSPQYGAVLSKYFQPIFEKHLKRLGEHGDAPGAYGSTQFDNWIYYLSLLSNSSIGLSRYYIQSLVGLSEQAPSKDEFFALFNGIAQNRHHHGSKLDSLADEYLSKVLVNAIQDLSQLRNDDIQGQYDQLLLISLVGRNSIELRQVAVQPMLPYLYHPNISLRLASTKLVLQTLKVPFDNPPATAKISNEFAKTIIKVVVDVFVENYDDGKKLWTIADDRKIQAYIRDVSKIFEEIIVVHRHQELATSAAIFSESVASLSLDAQIDSDSLAVAQRDIVELLENIGTTYHSQIDIVAPSIFRIENSIR